ncbi:MAG: exo-alpha-sialidase [Myxococcota bacterium]|nr:exo-alpha-sialidase [Myxococcota bacterium]
MQPLLISTRKGLFVAEARGGAGYRLTGGHFIGDNVTLAMADPRGGWYAALEHGHFGPKLHRSDDHGTTWVEITTPAYPPKPEGLAEQDMMGRELKWATELVWSLAPAPDRDGALWCGTIPGALFRSEDRGESWAIVEPLWFNDARKKWFGGGRNHPGIHSICVDPRDPRTIAVGVSCGGVWRTRDGGVTWANAAHGMRAAYLPPEQAYEVDSQDPHAIVQCHAQPDVFWAQHHNGIFRSTNGLESWTEVREAGPSTFGFAVAVDPEDGDTAWFIPAIKDEQRIPVDGKLVVTRTRDGGASFEGFGEGLPDQFAYDLVFRHGLALSRDGVLAFGSTSGNAFASTDRGESWSTISHHLPPVHAVTFG